MTPQERQRVAELFERLQRLESAPRDPQAEQAIAEGWRRAPNAAYALVQTVLIQDEALRNADARIRALEAGERPAEEQGSFLDNVRGTLFGRGDERRGSVPPVRAGAAPAFGGGSFLGTAAASAAGFIGGALLLDSFRSMFGGETTTGTAAAAGAQEQNQGENSPRDNAADSDLARDAGTGDIGRQQGDPAYDTASNESDFPEEGYEDADFDVDSDFV